MTARQQREAPAASATRGPPHGHQPVGEARTYRVRIDLDDTSPPVWRRIEVTSVLYLDQLHDVVQAAFGWTNSHLHRFASEPELRDPTRCYLCPFDVAEGEEGTPEEQVRLDEVLVAAGDLLFYQYDFGDNWRHTLRLEAVLGREPDAPPAVCTDGRRPGPPEDCGGVYGYELIVGARDPDHPTHAESAAEIAFLYGDEVDPQDFDLAPSDVEVVNARLSGLDLATRRARAEAPGPLGELLRAVLAPSVRRRLHRLLADAELDQPASIDADDAARMVGPYRWLLHRVGDDGIALTQAGYLPPAHVEAAVTELGLGEEWIGAGNREHLTMPVLHLRESARELGLLRKHHGKLYTTARGRSVADDPTALWHHLAQRMPLGARDEAERHAGLVVLLAIAARAGNDEPEARAAEVLGAHGWRHADGTPLTPSTTRRLLWDNLATLRRIRALVPGPDDRWPGTPTTQGMLFARAALRR